MSTPAPTQATPTPQPSAGYDVYLFPNALEALGEAAKPYVQDSGDGPHFSCKDVDTGGAFIEMTLEVRAGDGQPAEVELMVPSNMVRMIVSRRADAGTFGFGRGPAGGRH